MGGTGRTLITGASVGIGAALADVFAEHGHDLILVARNREKLQQRALALESTYHVKVAWFTEDLADPAGPARLHRAISAEGFEVHTLVNNAGVALYGVFSSTSLDTELRMIQLNIASLVELTKRFLPGMLQRRSGRILNVASVASFAPGPLMSVYYATKAFVLSFSEATNFELNPSGITVTALCPGPTDTEFKERAGSQRSRLFQAVVMDAATVARVGYDGMMQGKAVVIPGLRNKLGPVVVRLLPRSIITRLTYRAAKPAGPSPRDQKP